MHRSDYRCDLIYIYMSSILLLLKDSYSNHVCELDSFNNSSYHSCMCVLSTLCGNVDNHSPLYTYIYDFYIMYAYTYFFTLLDHQSSTHASTIALFFVHRRFLFSTSHCAYQKSPYYRSVWISGALFARKLC